MQEALIQNEVLAPEHTDIPSQLAVVRQPVADAAQAKIEAVANLTMKAYERASQLELTPEEIKDLQADFPDEAFKTGAAGKSDLIYIEHAYLRDRLNQVLGCGKWSIIPRNRWAEDFSTGSGKQASRVYVEAMLCIRGCFVAEAVGDMVYYKNNDAQNYGDAVEGAKTAALRRCCKELGVGLQAYKKDWCEGWFQRRKDGAKAPPVSRPAPVVHQKIDENTYEVPISWRQVEIHFGKMKGMKLGDLSPDSLRWWQTKWVPREVDPNAPRLKAALNESMKSVEEQVHPEEMEQEHDEIPMDFPPKKEPVADHWKDFVIHSEPYAGKKMGDLKYEEIVSIYNAFRPVVNKSTTVDDLKLKKFLIQWKNEVLNNE